MATETFSIPNISCGHCIMTIQKELEEVDGVLSVKGDPTTKEITVDWDAPTTPEKIKDLLKEINYPAAD